MNKTQPARRSALLAALVVTGLTLSLTSPCGAVTRTWSPNGFDDNWFNISNWTPNGSPDTGDDVVSNIFSVPIELFSGTTDAVDSVSLSAGADLSISGSGKLVVSNAAADATISLSGIGSELSIARNGLSLEADVIDITNRAEFHMGGLALIDRSINVSALSTISGTGLIELLNVPSSSDPLLVLDGTLRPQGGTLSVLAPSGGTIDLDGVAGGAFLDLLNGSLSIDAILPASDGFNGEARIGLAQELRVFGGMLFDDTSELNFVGGTDDQPAQVVSGLTTLLGDVNVSGVAGFRGPTVLQDAGSLTLPGTGDVLVFHDELTVFGEPTAAAAGRGKIVIGPDSTLSTLDAASLPVAIEVGGDLQAFGGSLSTPHGEATFGNYVQTSEGRMTIDLVEVLGVPVSDRIAALGIATLGGTLNVKLPLVGGTRLVPELGDEFTFLTADIAITGQFDTVSLPLLDPGLSWQLQYNNFDVTLAVVEGLPGDYNGDGKVDAADYTVWRDNLGASITLQGDQSPGTVTQADYDVWRANFGASSLSSSLTSSAQVPEPAVWGLMVVATLCGISRQLRIASRR